MLAAVAIGACTDANGDVSGGGLRFDAQPAELPDVMIPCTSNEQTWTSLYRDFFGPTAATTCSGGKGDEMNCHVNSTTAGSVASLDFCKTPFICGTTQNDCYNSFKAALIPTDTQGKTTAQNKQYFFEIVLRQTSGGPPTGVTPMPFRPGFAVFQPCDLQRIRNWANAGANND
jgi:hypothetical protein